MPRLPAGTVTLVFTDLEGSTRLLQDLGGDYARVLTDHRELLRRCFETHSGVVVDTQGDAFFVAFARAQDAVAAAVEAQRALAAHEWPRGTTPRVRMAVHTGEPAHVGEGFVGISVHRAARICGAGHGGQILLSSTTYDLLDGRLPPRVLAIELGTHRLKDLDRPETLLQLVVEGVPPVLTPPKSLEDQPKEATPFAGREDELAAAAKEAVAPPASESAPAHSVWRAAAKTRALDWRHFVHVPGRARLADRVEGLGLSIHASAQMATSEALADELRSLGRAFVTAARDARGADELLRREDRRTLERRLARYRERTLWDHHLQAADTLATEVGALAALEEAEHEFGREARKLEPQARALRGRVFDARHDAEVRDELIRELQAARASLEEPLVRLHAAYRSAIDAAAAAAAVAPR
jgi:class 3 adenylate cyclase